MIDYPQAIADVYADCTNALMQNIAKHFSFTAETTYTFDWETVKLAQMGKLTNESIRIIAEMTGQAPGLIEEALESSMLEAIAKNEPELKAAVDAGLIQGSAYTGLSPEMTRTLNYYLAQAKNTANLVNTTMLESTKAAYRKTVTSVAEAAKYEAAQQALNTAAGKVITGTTSHQAAVREAIGAMASNGLTGFVDRKGRKWTAEAYTNMTTRTTMGNVAREAVFQQNRDYGNDLLIVPVNATARPKCRPYQGDILSMSGKSGYTIDRYGNEIRYKSIDSTTYGEPDGLFGVNCHHTPPDPFILGMSRQHEEPASNVSERYEETQAQRQYERDVRAAKSKAAVYDANGDKEAFAAAAQKVKQKQAKLRDYTKQTGLTYRSDRTQVYGYGRSMAGKVTQAVRRAS